jgi:hypothetical protein
MEELNWKTSSYSSGNGQCVETAKLPDGGMAVRDTKNRDGASLRFTKDEWRAFISGVKNNEFD